VLINGELLFHRVHQRSFLRRLPAEESLTVASVTYSRGIKTDVFTLRMISSIDSMMNGYPTAGVIKKVQPKSSLLIVEQIDDNVTLPT
jgi:hypothetical protein